MEQLEKAYSPIVSTVPGILMLARLEQPANAYFLMVLRVFGSVTPVMPVFLLKAESPMAVTVLELIFSGTVTFALVPLYFVTVTVLSSATVYSKSP